MAKESEDAQKNWRKSGSKAGKNAGDSLMIAAKMRSLTGIVRLPFVGGVHRSCTGATVGVTGIGNEMITLTEIAHAAQDR